MQEERALTSSSSSLNVPFHPQKSTFPGHGVLSIRLRTKIRTIHHHQLNSIQHYFPLALPLPLSFTLVRLGHVLGFLQLHLEPFRADLEAVHPLDRSIRGRGRVKGHEAEALGQIRLLVDEHLGRDHVAERCERGGQVGVRELLRQVVDEQVAPVRTWEHTRRS